ncbi:MAG TPA: response regulator transcription factor, partial [Bacillales bacterium]|nr:response regulator transcription factor [Bacillales bacterium]
DLHAESIFQLSEQLLNTFPNPLNKELHISPVPWEGETLLVCSNGKGSPHVLPFITFTLQILSAGENMRRFSRQKQQWKDAVILFNEWTLRSRTLKEALEKVTFGFVKYLPFDRCALFAYSNDDRSGSGLFGYHLDTDEIRSIKIPIENMPLIQKNLKKLKPFNKNMQPLQPIYIADAKQGFPMQYVRRFQLETVVVAPIYVPSESKLIGAAILDEGPGKKFKMSRETFTALMNFGKSAGEVLAKFGGDRPERPRVSFSYHLSPREIEVLKLMAEGATTTEAAETLNLSEYTVRDYVSTIMQKMNARNRTEAAVRAIRNGII